MRFRNKTTGTGRCRKKFSKQRSGAEEGKETKRETYYNKREGTPGKKIKGKRVSTPSSHGLRPGNLSCIHNQEVTNGKKPGRLKRKESEDGIRLSTSLEQAVVRRSNNRKRSEMQVAVTGRDDPRGTGLEAWSRLRGGKQSFSQLQNGSREQAWLENFCAGNLVNLRGRKENEDGRLQ